MLLSGEIISGEFDGNANEFSIQKVKHFTTQTTINEKQLKSLYHYLKKHQDDTEGHVITLYDQLPIRLNREEISLLAGDLEKVQEMYLDTF